MTFVADNENKNDEKGSYPIVIGLKSEDHEEVQKNICKGAK